MQGGEKASKVGRKVPRKQARLGARTWHFRSKGTNERYVRKISVDEERKERNDIPNPN